MGEPAHRVWNSSSQAWLDMRTTWAAFQIRWCQVGNRNPCPCGHSLKLLVPCEGMISHSHSVTLSVSLSLLHTQKIHIHAYTRTPSWLFHTASEQQGARLFLAASLSSSCIWAGAQLHRGTRREQREALLASTPTSFPPLIAIPKGDQDPNKTEGFHKDQYPTSLQLLDSAFSEPHSYKINPKLPMLLVGPMVQIP